MKIKSLSQAILVAQQIFKNRDKIKDVFNDSTSKSEEKKEEMGSGLFSDVKTLREMLAASFKGTYKFPKRTLIYVIAGLVYFINPFDLVPDFILGLGFLDDAAVIAFVVKKLKKEIDKFKKINNYQDVEVIL